MYLFVYLSVCLSGCLFFCVTNKFVLYIISDKKQKEEATGVAQYDGLRLFSPQCYFHCIRVHNARKQR